MKIFFLTLFASIKLFAQIDNTSAITSLSISPQNPTTNDVVYLTINALWSSGSCEMTDHLVSGGTNNLLLNAYYDIGNATYICNNTSTINLGTFSAGQYTITSYINNNFAPSMQYAPMSISFTVTDNSLTNSNFEIDYSIKTYPNPVTDYLTIENIDAQSITISNVLGQIIYENNNLSEKKTVIDFSNFAKGLYFIKTNNNFKNITKIIKS